MEFNYLKICPCRICENESLMSRDVTIRRKRINSLDVYQCSSKEQEDSNTTSVNNPRAQLLEAKVKSLRQMNDYLFHSPNRPFLPNATRFPELCLNTLLYVHESVDSFRKNDVPIKRHRGFAFSEPVSLGRLRQSSIVTERQNHDRQVPQILEPHQDADLTQSTPKGSTQIKSKLNNEDIFEYLKQFENDCYSNKSFTIPTTRRILEYPYSTDYECNTRTKIDIAKQDGSVPNAKLSLGSEDRNSPRIGHSRSSYKTPNVHDRPIFTIEEASDILKSMPPVWNQHREVSVDTSSNLSSETDSDFSYYPFSVLQDNSFMSHVSDFRSELCELPSHLEDPDSPLPPYRPDFLGGSLDEMTRQFYLDEDALSDDVFVEDYQTFSNGDPFGSRRHKDYISTTNQNEVNSKECSPRANEMRVTDNLQSLNLGVSNSDDSKNVSLDFGPALGHCKQKPHSNVVDGNVRSDKSKNQPQTNTADDSDTGKDNATHLFVSNEEKNKSLSDYDDFELSGYNVTLANAFDSLRRNGIQSKSRKLWKERRAKMRRSNLFNSTLISFTDSVKISTDATLDVTKQFQPVDHGANGVSEDINEWNRKEDVMKHNEAKPLRGILKNKNLLCPYRSENCSTNVSVTLSNTKMNYSLYRQGSFVHSERSKSGNVLKEYTDGLVDDTYSLNGADSIDNTCNKYNTVSYDWSHTGWSSGLQHHHSPTYVSVGTQVNLSDAI